MKNSATISKTIASVSMLALTLSMSVPAAFAATATSTPILTPTASSTPTLVDNGATNSSSTQLSVFNFQTVPPVFVIEPATTTSTTTTPTSTTTPDTTKPTGMFSSNSSFHTGDNPIPFSVMFSEPITGLLASFFNIGNGTVSNFTSVSASQYTFDVTPAAPSGSVSVDLGGDKVTDFAGNFNIALPQIQRIIDPTLPNNYATDSGHGTGTTTATSTGTGGGNGTGSSTMATSSTAVITSGPTNGSSTASTTASFTFTAPGNAVIHCTFGSVTTSYVCGSPQTFTNLPEGTYTFMIVATDSQNATSSDMRTFTVDHTAPIISEVAPIASSTTPTPTYMFTSNEPGTITYGGSCSSATTTAVSGVNTITFNTLANGNYADCTITVRDAAGNTSATLPVTAFMVNAPVVLQAGSNSGDNSTAPTSGGGRSGGGFGGTSGGSTVTTTTNTGGAQGGGSATTNPSPDSGSTVTTTTGGGNNGGSRFGGGAGTSRTVAIGSGSVLGNATVGGSIDTGSTTATDASTSSSTLATAVDGSQAAAVGLARVPAILWGLLILLIIAIIGGTWYYRRETQY